MVARQSEPSLAEILQEYWGIAVRRKWVVLTAVALSLIGGVILYKTLPKIYRSTTLIMVEHQKIPEKFVQDVVTGSVQDRVNIIQQQVLSRSALTEVIKEFDLAGGQGAVRSLDQTIEKMRNGIEVRTEGRGSVRTFSIAYENEDPHLAKRVVDRLAAHFIEVNLKLREELVQGAADFLDRELERMKAELEAKERQLSDYKARHRGELPEDREENLQTLERVQKDLYAVTETAQRLSERLVSVEKEINEFRVSAASPAKGVVGEDDAEAWTARLLELENKLASLRALYKDTYPDVLATKKEIQRLKEQVNASPQEASSRVPIQTTDPYLQELEKQRAEIRRELKYLKVRQQNLIKRRNELERRVEKTPALEQEMFILLRDYDRMRANYQSLLDKRLNARVAQHLEKWQQGEQFRIIDPGHVPRSPYKPDRARIMMMALALGCGVGFGLAYTLDLLNPYFYKPEDIERLLGLHVLGSIPDFGLMRGRSGRRRLLGSPSVAPPLTTQKGQQDVMVYKPRWPGMPVIGGDGLAESEAEPILVAKWWPDSIIAEQFRVVASQLSIMEAVHSSSVFVMTSALQGEGKTTVAVNLAYTLARDLGRRTLVIDCDFKNASVHRYLHTPPEPGVSDVLEGKIELSVCLRQLDEIPLWVLPIGEMGGASTRLPKPQEMASLLRELRGQFEFILVDAPPVLPLADTKLLSQHADVALIVIRANRTPQHAISRALSALKLQTQPQFIFVGVKTSDVPYYMYRGHRAVPTAPRES